VRDFSRRQGVRSALARRARCDRDGARRAGHPARARGAPL